MGIEYRIRFQANRDELDSVIRTLPHFTGFDAAHGLYNLQIGSESEQMPNAWLSIEPDGLYLCDNGGCSADSAVIFRSVIDLALRFSARIEVEEL